MTLKTKKIHAGCYQVVGTNAFVVMVTLESGNLWDIYVGDNCYDAMVNPITLCYRTKREVLNWLYNNPKVAANNGIKADNENE